MTRSVPCNWTGTEDASRTSASLLPAPAALRGHCCLAHAPAAPKCQGHLLLPQGPHSGDRNLHMAATPPAGYQGLWASRHCRPLVRRPEGPASGQPRQQGPSTRTPPLPQAISPSSIHLVPKPGFCSTPETEPRPSLGSSCLPGGAFNKQSHVWGHQAKQKVGKAQSPLSGRVTSGLESLDDYQPVCRVLTFPAACSSASPCPASHPRGKKWGRCHQAPRT